MSWPQSYRSSPVMVAVMVLTVALHAGGLWWLTRESSKPAALPAARPITIDMIAAPVPPPASGLTGHAASRPRSQAPPAQSPPPASIERPPGPRVPPIAVAPEVPKANLETDALRNTESLSDPSLREGSLAPALAGDFGVAEPDDEGRSGGSDPVASKGDGQHSSSAGDEASSQGALPDAPSAQASVPGGPATPEPLRMGAPTPGPIEGGWRYLVFYGEFQDNRQVAVVDYVMSLRDGQYHLHTEGQALGLLALFYRGRFRQSSSGKLDGGGFQPDRYEEQRGDRGSRTVTMIRNGIARARYDDGRSDVIVPGAQDRLSLGAQLAWLASTHSLSLLERQWTVELIGISSLRTITFTIQRDVVLELPSGPRQLIRLRSEDGDGGAASGSLELWLAQDGGLMPVRIRLEDQRGQVLDQILAGG